MTAGGNAAVRVLFVCTANRCRSPMAEVLLRRRLDAAGIPAWVGSAGTSAFDGDPVPAEAVEAVAGIGGGAGSGSGGGGARSGGGGLEGHRSRPVTAELVGDASLVLGLARRHVRELTVADPSVFPRCFTLKELVRRGQACGARRAGERLSDWLAVVGGDRRASALVGDDPADDVDDPIGRSPSVYRRVAEELDALTGELVRLVWPG